MFSNSIIIIFHIGRGIVVIVWIMISTCRVITVILLIIIWRAGIWVTAARAVRKWSVGIVAISMVVRVAADLGATVILILWTMLKVLAVVLIVVALQWQKSLERFSFRGEVLAVVASTSFGFMMLLQHRLHWRSGHQCLCTLVGLRLVILTVLRITRNIRLILLEWIVCICNKWRCTVLCCLGILKINKTKKLTEINLLLIFMKCQILSMWRFKTICTQ